MCGIYVHIPFCRRKCIYCDFYSMRFDEKLSQDYAEALKNNIALRSDKALMADTIYFGGGTPTTLRSSALVSVLEAIKNSFNVSNDSEITVEANPCTVTYESLRELYNGGFNRISFGIQSAVNSELSALSRLHNFKQAEEAVLNAERAGFSNISADIMAGILNQTGESLLYSIDKITSLPVSHISAYMLKVEENTPLCSMITKDESLKKSIADDDEMSERYLMMCDSLEERGFNQYEISNFSKPGFESRHNLKYWRCGEYLGFGSHAHSYWDGKRFFENSSVEEFIDNNGRPQISVTDDNINKAEEYIMLSLRLTEGLSVDRLGELDSTGKYKNIIRSAERLNELSGDKLINVSPNRKNISLTKSGFLVSNTLIASFI